MNSDQLELKVTLDRENAEALLVAFDQRLSFLQRIARADGEETWVAAQREKDGLLPLMMALEATLRMRSTAEH
jgi:hypothetical protein